MTKYIGAQEEFLTDNAAYFQQQKSLYLEIKKNISEEVELPLSSIRVCGSAYWGYSFNGTRPFSPGVSDLDVAIIDTNTYVRMLSEVRAITRNFNDLTSFSGDPKNPEIFIDYALKKGIILLWASPRTRLKEKLVKVSDSISRKYIDHFQKISFLIYDTEISFTNKQAGAFEKFRMVEDD